MFAQTYHSQRSQVDTHQKHLAEAAEGPGHQAQVAGEDAEAVVVDPEAQEGEQEQGLQLLGWP